MADSFVDLCSEELSYSPIGIVLNRFFFLLIFGYQIRQPCDLKSQMATLSITLLLINQILPISSESNVIVLCQNQLRPILIEWTLLVVSTLTAIRYIHYRGLMTKIVVMISSWWVLAATTFYMSLNSLLAPSFLRLDIAFCIATIVAFFSMVYPYELDLPTLRKCIEIVVEGYLSIAVDVSDIIRHEHGESTDKLGVTETVDDKLIDCPESTEKITHHSQGSNENPRLFPFEHKYKPLKLDEIRLLRLRPRKANEQLSLDMEHRLLSNFHPTRRDTFAALSYHWGDHSETTEILINRSICTVTMNLYLALCELEGKGHDLLWVDALSINQKDTDERNSQVMRMYSIYKNAHPVITWLGRATTESNSVMMMLNETQNFDEIHHFDGKSCAASLRDIKEFFARVYFERIWVVQEITCAAKVVFLCCELMTTIEQIEKLVAKMRSLEVNKSDIHFQESLDTVQGLLDIRKQRSLPLLKALSCTRNRKAHVQHDKVFALLNLATDAKGFVIEPNYRLSEVELCKQITRNWITSKRRLDIILTGQRQTLGNQRHLPSWCPDFLSFGQATPDCDMLEYLCTSDKRYRMGKECKFWSATNNSDVDIDLLVPKDNDGILHLRGISLGRINSTGPCKSDTNVGYHNIEHRTPKNLDSSSLPVYNAICRLLLIYDTKYERLTKRPTLLFMLYNIAWNMYMSTTTERDPESDQAIVNLWLRRNRNYVINGWKLKEHGWASFWVTSKNYMGSLVDTNAKTLTIADYNHITKHIAMIIREDMRLVTFHNGMIGWAHNAVKCGDEIFLLAGCTVPAVLRKAGERYTVVGRAYVDNRMDGEGWKANDIREIFVC